MSFKLKSLVNCIFLLLILVTPFSFKPINDNDNENKSTEPTTEYPENITETTPMFDDIDVSNIDDLDNSDLIEKSSVSPVTPSISDSKQIVSKSKFKSKYNAKSAWILPPECSATICLSIANKKEFNFRKMQNERQRRSSIPNEKLTSDKLPLDSITPNDPSNEDYPNISPSDAFKSLFFNRRMKEEVIKLGDHNFKLTPKLRFLNQTALRLELDVNYLGLDSPGNYNSNIIPSQPEKRANPVDSNDQKNVTSGYVDSFSNQSSVAMSVSTEPTFRSDSESNSTLDRSVDSSNLINQPRQSITTELYQATTIATTATTTETESTRSVATATTEATSTTTEATSTTTGTTSTKTAAITEATIITTPATRSVATTISTINYKDKTPLAETDIMNEVLPLKFISSSTQTSSTSDESQFYRSSTVTSLSLTRNTVPQNLTYSELTTPILPISSNESSNVNLDNIHLNPTQRSAMKNNEIEDNAEPNSKKNNITKIFPPTEPNKLENLILNNSSEFLSVNISKEIETTWSTDDKHENSTSTTPKPPLSRQLDQPTSTQYPLIPEGFQSIHIPPRQDIRLVVTESPRNPYPFTNQHSVRSTQDKQNGPPTPAQPNHYSRQYDDSRRSAQQYGQYNQNKKQVTQAPAQVQSYRPVNPNNQQSPSQIYHGQRASAPVVFIPIQPNAVKLQPNQQMRAQSSVYKQAQVRQNSAKQPYVVEEIVYQQGPLDKRQRSSPVYLPPQLFVKVIRQYFADAWTPAEYRYVYENKPPKVRY